MGVVEHLKKEKETATVMTTAEDLFNVEPTTALGAMEMIVASTLQKVPRKMLLGSILTVSRR